MVPTYGTFGGELPPPDLETLQGRVLWQEGILSQVVPDLLQSVTGRVVDQEEQLAALYRPLIATAKRRLVNQSHSLVDIQRPILDALRTRLSQQRAAMRGIQSDTAFSVGDEDLVRLPLPVSVDEPVPVPVPSVDDYVPLPVGGEPTPIPEPPIPPPLPEPGVCPAPVVSCPAPVVTVVPVPIPAPFPIPSPPIPPGVIPPGVPPTSPVPPPVPPVPPSPIPTPVPPPPVPVPTPVPIPPPGILPFPAPFPFTPFFPSVPGTVKPPPIFDPSDPEVCVNVGEYLQRYRTLGEGARELARGLLAGGLMTRQLALAVVGLSTSAAALLPMETLRTISKGILDGTIAVGRMATGRDTLLSGYDSDTLMGLYFAKSIIANLRDQTLGVSFPIHWTTNFGMHLQTQEQIIDYLIAYVHNIRVPDQNEVRELYIAGNINEDHASCLTKLNGAQWQWQRGMIDARRFRLSAEEVVRDMWRNNRPRDEVVKELFSMGWNRADEVDRYLAVQQFLPPPSDVIRWTLRDVFDPKKLGLAEMKKEYAEQVGMLPLFESQGMDKITVRGKDGKEYTYDIPLYYWISSYEEVSPTQVFEMLHRLRPNRVDRYKLPGPGGVAVVPGAVTIDTVRSLLKEKDYNPIWRDRLAAISYRPLGRIDVRRMYSIGVFGKPQGKKGYHTRIAGAPNAIEPAEIELTERYLDQGYSPDDAAYLMAYTATEYDQSKSTKERNRTVNLACRMYTQGSIRKDVAIQRLTDATGDAARAERILFLCDGEFSAKLVDEAIAGVRRQFIRAEMSQQDARNALNGIGIRNDAIAGYLQVWEHSRVKRGRDLTAAQVLDALASKIIDRAEASRRLANLDYSDESARIMVRKVELGELAKTRKQMEAEARARRKLLESVAKVEDKERAARERAERQRFARYLATRKEPQLVKEWKERLVTPDELIATLLLKGYTEADARKWLITNNPHKGKKDGGG